MTHESPKSAVNKYATFEFNVHDALRKYSTELLLRYTELKSDNLEFRSRRDKRVGEEIFFDGIHIVEA